MRAVFPDVPGCDWAIRVTNAVRVQMDQHAEDLHAARDEFQSWLSQARTAFDEGIAFTAVAASYDEAQRFQQAVSEIIAQRDLFLVVVLMHRESRSGQWEEIDETGTTSDEEIEAELQDLAQLDSSLDDDMTS